MKNNSQLLLLIFLSISGCSLRNSASGLSSRQPQSEFAQSPYFLENIRIGSLAYRQRMGFLLESNETLFKGCVIYLQGLGDSILNHEPLFSKLSRAGYRVLLFDYLGQGGSEGSMSDTRINAMGDPFPKKQDYEIGFQAKFVWKRYSDFDDPWFSRNCSESPKRVIGWSTGGLAAYKLASQGWAEESILIAPGIVPKVCVGEAAAKTLSGCMSKYLSVHKVITQQSLTTNIYANGKDPHVDPIKPDAPLQVKEFVVNLLSTAFFQARFWKVASNKKGLIFLSGANDTYVNSAATVPILQRNAPSFKIVPYSAALHEIDNEVSSISNDMHEKTIEFFNSNLVK